MTIPESGSTAEIKHLCALGPFGMISAMRPLAFTDDLKFGVTVIDSQHRRMVNIVNQLLGAALGGELGEAEDRLLDELVRLAEINFRTEKEWMRRCRYERCEAHTESHALLLRELVELRAGMFSRHES